jgi:hypothetical protein
VLKSSEVLAQLRDLCVFLHRGNAARAESAMSQVAEYLKAALVNPETGDADRVRQTSFALEEVRTLFAQQDFGGAAAAARDAVKEWKQAATPRL